MDALFVFITVKGSTVKGKKYRYDDTCSVCERDNEVIIDYSSQMVWKTGDPLLMNENLKTFIFIRDTQKECFKYAGKVSSRSVLRARSEDAPLRMRFTIKMAPNTKWNSSKEFVPPQDENQRGTSGRFKTRVYNALGALPMKGNSVTTGIVPVRWTAAASA
jgi:hypothetical protein